jgi:hypothetical protein
MTRPYRAGAAPSRREKSQAKPKETKGRRRVEVVIDCPDCNEGELADGTRCGTCRGTAKVLKVTREQDYMTDEDPQAGVLAYRAWLHGVFGRWWQGIGDVAKDLTLPDGLPTDPDALIKTAKLDPEEARLFRLQMEGKNHVAICAETDWTPYHLRRVVTRLNKALALLHDRIKQQRAAQEDA